MLEDYKATFNRDPNEIKVKVTPHTGRTIKKNAAVYHGMQILQTSEEVMDLIGCDE